MQAPETIQKQVEARFDERTKVLNRRDEALGALKAGREETDWRDLDDPERVAVRAASLGLTADAAALLASPEDQSLGRLVLERIIGANNLLGVNFLYEGAQATRAVGQILIPVAGGKRLGTGFMVTSRLMMTNNHVIGNMRGALTGQIRFDFHRREDGAIGPTSDFMLDPDRFFITDSNLDFTIVAVEPTNARGARVADRGWHPLNPISGKAIVGERVNIVQHPGGLPQQVAIHENQIMDVDGDWLRYRTDTEPGSSGSPVFNDSWDLAALHHASVPHPGGTGIANEGARVSRIVDWLRQRFRPESEPGTMIELLEELYAAVPPSTLSTGIHASIQHSQFSDTAGIHASLRDGTATWTIPVELSIGIGTTCIGGSSPQRYPEKTPTTASPEDPVLYAALTKLEDSATRPYYNEDADQEAIDQYYPANLAELGGTQLFDRLGALLNETHETVLAYRTARMEHLYAWIDLQKDGDLRGVYSHLRFDPAQVIHEEAAMEAAREAAMQEYALRESTGASEEFMEQLEVAFPFNCEHAVPQSWFDRTRQMKTDLHHLFTCEWGCNSFRGNRAYFDFDMEAFRDQCGESGEGKFEPANGKGAVARSTLYFLVRYPGEIGDSLSEMPRQRIATLLQWHSDEPPDLWERHRNAEIHKVQGNRNPFVDLPDLVDRVEFSRGLS